jgi:hypothetical protein
MLLRAALTIAYGLMLGVWAYTDQKASGAVFGDLHNSVPFELFVLLLGIAVGFAVGRAWALLALLGPLIPLAILEADGFVSPSHDGTEPLFSPPGISLFVWYGLMLLLGIGLRRGWERLRTEPRNQSAVV